MQDGTSKSLKQPIKGLPCHPERLQLHAAVGAITCHAFSGALLIKLTYKKTALISLAEINYEATGKEKCSSHDCTRHCRAVYCTASPASALCRFYCRADREQKREAQTLVTGLWTTSSTWQRERAQLRVP